MNAISFNAHTPLSQNDITRLPNQASAAIAAPAAAVTQSGDYYGEPKKMSGLTKTIIALAVAAGALVTLKRTNLLKVAPDATGTMSKIKGYAAKAADYVEYPFVKAYKFVKGLFGKNADDVAKAADNVTPPPAAVTPPPAAVTP
ncbi:MAG: hypothetical protein PHX18_03880 [Candidatus Gastranaerophilales bacterium]|nr:hypothetical protein [Candidatus Gastranaerophilales bacterium]